MATGTFFILLSEPAFKTADVIGVHHTTRRKANDYADLAAIRQHVADFQRVESISHTELKQRQRKGWDVCA